VKPPKKRDLARYIRIRNQRLAAQRRARDLEQMEDELEQSFLPYMREHGGPEQVCLPHGYRLAIVTEAGRVKWKVEFEKLAGHQLAEELIAAAPRREKLVVDPPAPPAAHQGAAA
jgi:hypothetical protein